MIAQKRTTNTGVYRSSKSFIIKFGHRQFISSSISGSPSGRVRKRCMRATIPSSTGRLQPELEQLRGYEGYDRDAFIQTAFDNYADMNY